LISRPYSDTPLALISTRGHAAAAIGSIIQTLLAIGIADTDASMRETVLSALDSRFDHFLAQSENLVRQRHLSLSLSLSFTH